MISGTANATPVCDKPMPIKENLCNMEACIVRQRELIELIGGSIIGNECMRNEPRETGDTPPMIYWLPRLIAAIDANNKVLEEIKANLF